MSKYKFNKTGFICDNDRAATQYCITNSIKFVIIDDDWFFNNFNGYDEILKYIDIDRDLLIKRMKGVFKK